MPIEWIELDAVREGISLVITNVIVDWELYGEDEIISWKNSYIHEHLERLYNDIFSDEEKNSVIKSEYGPLFC